MADANPAPAAPAAPEADPVVSYTAPNGSPIGGQSNDIDLNDPVVSYTAPPPAGAGRSGIGEVGAGFARGALVDLPTLVGQAAKFAAPAGSGVANFGQGLVQSAATRGQQSWLTLNPAEHGGFVNALNSFRRSLRRSQPLQVR
jgi:hypothetical protein